MQEGGKKKRRVRGREEKREEEEGRERERRDEGREKLMGEKEGGGEGGILNWKLHSEEVSTKVKSTSAKHKRGREEVRANAPPVAA